MTTVQRRTDTMKWSRYRRTAHAAPCVVAACHTEWATDAALEDSRAVLRACCPPGTLVGDARESRADARSRGSLGSTGKRSGPGGPPGVGASTSRLSGQRASVKCESLRDSQDGTLFLQLPFQRAPCPGHAEPALFWYPRRSCKSSCYELVRASFFYESNLID